MGVCLRLRACSSRSIYLDLRDIVCEGQLRGRGLELGLLRPNLDSAVVLVWLLQCSVPWFLLCIMEVIIGSISEVVCVCAYVNQDENN